MIIREYQETDLETIKRLHNLSGFDYKLPELSRSEFFSRRILGDSESVGMAAFMRLNAEAYLICDPKWRTPVWRADALRQLHTVCNEDAREAGVKEVFAFLPPEVEKVFGKRLTKFGWGTCRSDWRYYFKEVT